MNKESIENYLITHQFDAWEWNDKEKYLKVYKMNRNWLIPCFEFEYGIVSVDIIFKNYVVDYI